MSPFASSSITIAVVSESVPRPPHFSESVIVRMPSSCAFSTISHEKPAPGPGSASSFAARGLHFLFDEARDGLEDRALVFVDDEDGFHAPSTRRRRVDDDAQNASGIALVFLERFRRLLERIGRCETNPETSILPAPTRSIEALMSCGGQRARADDADFLVVERKGAHAGERLVAQRERAEASARAQHVDARLASCRRRRRYRSRRRRPLPLGEPHHFLHGVLRVALDGVRARPCASRARASISCATRRSRDRSRSAPRAAYAGARSCPAPGRRPTRRLSDCARSCA